jgi:hypothetical protein
MSVTGDNLRAAAVRVRAGWRRCALRDPFGNVCAVGSLGVTEPDQISESCRAHAEELRFLALAIGNPARITVVREMFPLVDPSVADATMIAAWNDAPTQTAENVASTLELAAILADEAHAQRSTERTEDVCSFFSRT